MTKEKGSEILHNNFDLEKRSINITSVAFTLHCNVFSEKIRHPKRQNFPKTASHRGTIPADHRSITGPIPPANTPPPLQRKKSPASPNKIHKISISHAGARLPSAGSIVSGETVRRRQRGKCGGFSHSAHARPLRMHGLRGRIMERSP